MGKNRTILEKTTSSREYKMAKRRADLSCDICPPHGGENSGRRAKHGAKKRKQKNHRRK